MRIAFATVGRPTRVAKSVRKALLGQGYDRRYTLVREAVASMFGYRSWNDLLGNVGAGQSDKPRDHDDARDAYATVLSRLLDVPLAACAAAVDVSGFIGEAEAGPIDLEVALRSVAQVLSRPDAEWKLDGDTFAHVTYHTLRCSLSRDGTAEGLLGNFLSSAGFPWGTDDGTEPDAPVVAWLSRIDRRALRLLRLAGRFSDKAYDLARSLPLGSAFETFADEYPSVGGAEITMAAKGMGRGRQSPRDPEQAALLASDDPVASYVSLVDRFVRNQWTTLRLDPASARAVLDRVFRGEARGSVDPWDVAFLSFCPSDKLPKKRAQVEAALLFVERWTHLFDDDGIPPSDFYRTFDGDWAALRRATEPAGPNALSSAYQTAACTVAEDVARAMGTSLGEGWEREDDPVVGILADRLRERGMRGRGLVDVLASVRAWDSATDGKPPAGQCHALVASGLLPADCADPDAFAIARRFGIVPERLVEAVLDDSEASLAEVEARISAPGTPVQPREGDDGLVGSVTFHSLTLAGLRFEAVLSADGPYLACGLDGVALGHCTLIDSVRAKDGTEGWQVCKYSSNEPRIDLAGLTAADLSRLSREFGIPGGQTRGPQGFYRSPAFEGLKRYVATHPRLAARYASYQEYVGDWHSRAKASPSVSA